MKRKYLVDTHMHTLASGHAYNTFDEMMDAAAEEHMSVVCITDHGPSMPGSAHPYYFTNLRVIKKEEWQHTINGGHTLCGCVRMVKGFEANILDYEGNTDYDDLGDAINDLKYIIASFHSVCLEPGTEKQNTAAYIGAIKKPYVCTLGHIDDGRIPCDFEKVIRCAKENNVLIELNNSSMAPTTFRLNSVENAKEYLQICKEQEAMVVLGSDAHYKDDIGNFSLLTPILDAVNFPDDLIINTDEERFLKFLEEKYNKRLEFLEKAGEIK